MKQDFIRNNAQLTQALRQAQNEKTDALIEASNNSIHVVSIQFEEKMKQLIHAQRKPYYNYTNTQAKKAALALAAALILLLATVFSVSALRKPVMRFFVEVYEKFSSVLFMQDDSTVELPKTIESRYLPQWLPEGYQLDETQSTITDSQTVYVFASQLGKVILFQQYTIASTGVTINTEGVLSEEILIDQHVGIYYSNLGSQTILWENGQYGFSLAGPIAKKDLLAIACSIEKI